MRPVRGVTELLRAWSSGDPEALGELAPVIYDELRAIARRHFQGEPAGHTLQPTALVHETFLRLAGEEEVDWHSRAHFFASAARVMRRILVDHARRRRAAKRGGGVPTIPLDEARRRAQPVEADLLGLDEALSRLSSLDGRQARIVELRYFAGLTVTETAAVLGIGTATVDREWRAAKAWLLRELRPGG